MGARNKSFPTKKRRIQRVCFPGSQLVECAECVFYFDPLLKALPEKSKPSDVSYAHKNLLLDFVWRSKHQSFRPLHEHESKQQCDTLSCCSLDDKLNHSDEIHDKFKWYQRWFLFVALTLMLMLVFDEHLTISLFLLASYLRFQLATVTVLGQFFFRIPLQRLPQHLRSLAQ